MVIADVIADNDGLVDLLTSACSVVSETPGRKIVPLLKDKGIRRKRLTIERGNPKQLLGTDESAAPIFSTNF